MLEYPLWYIYFLTVFSLILRLHLLIRKMFQTALYLPESDSGQAV